MQNSDNLTLEAPSLPKGGGALTGLSGQMGAAGPDGAATLAVALPISAGRGYAPSLGLNYSSQAGNGSFGMGWSCGTLAIRRRTRMGVPTYTPEDEYIAPDGEVLVHCLDADDKPHTRASSTLLGNTLGATYSVSGYRSRVERDFSRLEYWQPTESGTAADFWVLYSPDGQVHLLGYEAQARIGDPNAPAHTAQWLLNASVSAYGEQIYYRYRREDEAGCSSDEKKLHPEASAQRYLSEVHYGNITPGRTFPCLTQADALAAGWLFVLVFDYGERSTALADIPPYVASGEWTCRQDCFSGYEFGFDLRTRRLCRQVLMFHRLDTLAGVASGEDTPALVSRLLLEYEESEFVSTLASAQPMAFDNDETQSLQTLPPLVFGWQTFVEPQAPQWHPLNALGNLNALQPYQYVDLYGEGLAGIVYQDAGAWWYRAPVRLAQSNDANAITWAPARPLPSTPALRNSATLVDLNGDGRLQWVVSAVGVNGHYEQNLDNPGQWLHFTPLSALPVEYAHPRAQLADLTGSGFADLVLIGPRSVRLYAGQGDGWESGQTVLQSGNVTLPVPGADPRTLVAFSDPLGSGQQHLMQVNAEGVTCWPNLGHGRFGQPLALPGFSQPAQGFNSDQVFLADIDGCGAVDIIYAHADRLEIYRNQSGNGFASPFVVSLPGGVRYDSTCQLQVADVLGLGVASVLLSVPHPTPTHWVLTLSVEKPWLLNETNNNMGAHQELHYRSSAQFWLDEKARTQQQEGEGPRSYLPFPLHMLWRTETLDEITGNRLVSEVRYRHGAWDGREREFRGFGYVEVQDTDTSAARGSASALAMPLLTRNWYATGLSVIDDHLPTEYWSGDKDAFPTLPPRYTTGSGEDEVLCPEDVVTANSFWLTRALKGQLLHSEVYGLDGSEQAGVPYSVTEQRPQVRLIAEVAGTPVVWPSVLESRSYHYERVSSDPQCAQQISLSCDEVGQPLKAISVNYPRRPQPTENPYPDTLPKTLFTSSYDDQQQLLRLTLSQQSWHHLVGTERGIWLTGLPDASRSDVLSFTADQVPPSGLSLEVLATDNSLIGDKRPHTFAGQQQTYWLAEDGNPSVTKPAFPPRQAHTVTAELDEAIVQAVSVSLTTVDIADELRKAGYQQMDYLFARDDEFGRQLWVIRSGDTQSGDAAQFWRPMSYRDSPLNGSNTLEWDAHYCVPIRHQDAAGLEVSAQYDWRFLTPQQITDANANVHQVRLDGLGRVTCSRFSGTENGVPAGYSNAAFILPGDTGSALTLLAPQPIAQCFVYTPDSWMKKGAEKMPPHVAALVTDRYDDDAEQQIRQQVMFSDGFGRELQTATRHETGDAWQRTEGGGLVLGADGAPATAPTDFRWVVSGRTEYDNKGQAVRTYQPYFLNDWRYISDDSARQDLWADTHKYDPTGQVIQVTTAKGYLRRTLFTPWFSVSEDENDTATL
ncbi:SpvB/TcaC N-terminal domain-containing protein [Aeromonas popoffii]|uniref:SpvB/TcaC N-terminal domain-containing protein n=1 Tax=Aeromonas popoffii TaxID=70856 RepID=UPI0030D20D37